MLIIIDFKNNILGSVAVSLDAGSTFNIDRAKHCGIGPAKVSYIVAAGGAANSISKIIIGGIADCIGNGIFCLTSAYMVLYSIFCATSDFYQEEIGQTLWFITFAAAHAVYNTTILVMIRYRVFIKYCVFFLKILDFF